MKIELRSHVNFMSILKAGLAFGIAACSTGPGTNDYVGKKAEVSLSEDRSQLDELRKDIPVEKKRENDELAILLKSLNPGASEIILPSHEISDRFNRLMRKKRDENQRGLRIERDEFGRVEKTSREKFLHEQKSERDNFNGYKKNAEDRRSFTEVQSQKRDSFFADSRERRLSFEEQMRAKQKDFEFLYRTKTTEFNELLKSYNANIRDQAKIKKKEPTVRPIPSTNQTLESEAPGK